MRPLIRHMENRCERLKISVQLCKLGNKECYNDSVHIQNKYKVSCLHS